MSSSVSITHRVAALSDEQAVTTLALVLERQGLTVDPFTHAEEEAHLREALNQSEITDRVEPTPGATRGDLARTGLTYLAENEATRGLIDHAIADRAARRPRPHAAAGHRRPGATRVPRRHRPRPRTRKGLEVPIPHQRALRFHDREAPRPAPRKLPQPRCIAAIVEL